MWISTYRQRLTFIIVSGNEMLRWSLNKKKTFTIFTVEVKVNETPVQVTLCDTAGQDSLDQLRQLSYPDCDVFLLCFSVIRPASFHAIKRKWAPTFYKTKASLLLVGTQCDLRTNSQIVASLKVPVNRSRSNEQCLWNDSNF